MSCQHEEEKTFKVFAITVEGLVVPLSRRITNDEQYKLEMINCSDATTFFEHVEKFYSYNLTPFKRRAVMKVIQSTHKRCGQNLLEIFERFVYCHVPRQKRKYLDVVGVMLDIITHPENSGSFQLNEDGDAAYYIEYT
jgi:hypothetical protein